MTPGQVDRLREASDALVKLQQAGLAPAAIVAVLVKDHGARLHIHPWKNSLRFGGVTSSSTSDAGSGLLTNWARLATLRLMAARHEEQAA